MTAATSRRPRLIEVAFPLDEVSRHSRHEKNIRHGHISTLHIWWARRPLAACRAFIYASLVDDPADPAARDELLKEVADLAAWQAVREPETVVRSLAEGGSGLTGAELLRRARERILRDNGGRAPKLLDPFAGGGAIPLEGLRLGCEVEASDLNPVAVLILKGTVEYPQLYGRPLAEQRERWQRGEQATVAGVEGGVPGYIRAAGVQEREQQIGFDENLAETAAVAAYARNPLAADVRYWGGWMLERARAELARYYPPDPDGSVPVAYLWSRTVPCPNCAAQMPLLRQYWLARKEHKKVALQPVVDRERRTVDFEVVEGANVSGDPGEASVARGDVTCLVCRQVVKATDIREAARAGKMGQTLTSVVLEANGRGGKSYRADVSDDALAFGEAAGRLLDLERAHIGELSLVPDEPVPHDPRKIDVELYGIDQWGKLFNARQLLALTTFARLVGEAHVAMLDAGLDAEYARAVATYLALAIDRLADWCSTICRWISVGEKLGNTFSRQAIPMVWDYCEANALFGDSWSFEDMIVWIAENIEANSGAGEKSASVSVRSAMDPASAAVSLVITDPPYYDSINYADLSDYFYVWLKRSLGMIQSELLSLPLTPKREQAVMNVYAEGGPGMAAARQRYVGRMAAAFRAMAAGLEPEGSAGIVFAHTDADAWATLIAGLLEAGLIPAASWPIDTEREGKVSGLDQARLKTSVWMACRKREVDAGAAFLGDVLAEMEPVIRERLLFFWQQGIRGADFFISAIGPALSVFGRHTQVLKPDGAEVTVREFLDLVRAKSAQVALEQVLHGADMGAVDPLTALYVSWVWSHGRAALDTGDAIALCLATGADYRLVVRPHTIAKEYKEKSKKRVKLRGVGERAADDEELGTGTPARPAPLIDQLQRAAWLWRENRRSELGAYREQLGESRWTALRTLAQAMVECLPDGDEDRRLFNGLLGASVMALGGAAFSAAAGGEQEQQGRLVE